MVDLKALRERIADNGCDCGTGPGELHSCLGGLAEQAADELEQLRHRVVTAGQAFATYVNVSNEMERLRAEARRPIFLDPAQ